MWTVMDIEDTVWRIYGHGDLAYSMQYLCGPSLQYAEDIIMVKVTENGISTVNVR